MSMMQTLVQQILVMFLLIAVGAFCERKQLLPISIAKTLCRFLMFVVSPVLSIKALQQERTPQLLRGYWVMIGLTLLFFAASALVANAFIPKKADSQYQVERACATSPNTGFFSFPILISMFGSEGIFYGAVFNCIFVIFIWTYVASTLSGQRSIRLKNMLLNPGTIAFVIASILFLGNIQIPTIPTIVLDHVYNLNTPLAMLITGMYVSRIHFPTMLRTLPIYRAAIIRTVALPAVLLLFFWATSAGQWFEGSRTLALASLISISCGSAVGSIVMAALFDKDSQYASQIVLVSTVLTLLTMPAVYWLGNLLL